MRTVLRAWLGALVVAGFAGCASEPTVTSIDFSTRAGLYVLGYATDPAIRRSIEDQLVADLEARDMVGFASHRDLPQLEAATREEVISAANGKRAIGVLLVNQVVPGEDGVIDNPARISPEHPDLRAFYEYTLGVEAQPIRSGPVFAEVTGFLLGEDRAKLFWSGTTWSFRADGQGGAIRGISGNIADEFARMRDAMRSN